MKLYSDYYDASVDNNRKESEEERWCSICGEVLIDLGYIPFGIEAFDGDKCLYCTSCKKSFPYPKDMYV